MRWELCAEAEPPPNLEKVSLETSKEDVHPGCGSEDPLEKNIDKASKGAGIKPIQKDSFSPGNWGFHRVPSIVGIEVKGLKERLKSHREWFVCTGGNGHVLLGDV